MTLRELSQLFYLTQEIKADQKRLEKLTKERIDAEQTLLMMRQEIDGLASPSLDGMPKSQSVGSRVESNVIRLTEQEDRVKSKRAAILHLETMISQRQALRLMERAQLEEYISGIPDSLTRQIFQARFVDGLTWDNVADAVGCVSVDAVKKTCYRYIKTH